jgi:hypothetical protein
MKNVYEIFEEVSKTNSKNEKMQILRNNATYALKNVLKGTFDPNISFVFDKIPEYKPSDAPPGLGYSSIHQELGRVYLFEKNSPKVSPSLTMKRKEEILIQMLESLEKREAEVFANMLLKKQRVKGLTYNLVKETFPDLL